VILYFIHIGRKYEKCNTLIWKKYYKNKENLNFLGIEKNGVVTTHQLFESHETKKKINEKK
jgi:hypothetical protein